MSRKVINIVGKKNVFYLKNENLTDYLISAITYTVKIKNNSTNEINIVMAGEYFYLVNTDDTYSDNEILAIEVNLDQKILYKNEENVSVFGTLKDMIISYNLWEDFLAIPRITEEEFYDITLPTE